MVAPDGGVVALAALVRSAAFYRHKAIVFDAFFAPSPSLLGIRTFGIVAAHPPPAAQHLGLARRWYPSGPKLSIDVAPTHEGTIEIIPRFRGFC
jgi:hypothetical protein